jgi:TPR repeat protein
MFNMGLMYKSGEGVSKSRSEARNWYQNAAARGLTPLSIRPRKVRSATSKS